eukprot:COSAG05_NODE_12019_length_486_cov_21.444444_1_plen_63_part_01
MHAVVSNLVKQYRYCSLVLPVHYNRPIDLPVQYTCRSSTIGTCTAVQQFSRSSRSTGTLVTSV